jgi:hypothetical protein
LAFGIWSGRCHIKCIPAAAFQGFPAHDKLATVLLGLGYAFYLRSADPAKFEQIGRLIYQGAPET